MITRDRLGQDGFVWWFGVIEDVDDPLKSGRVRARPRGWYPDGVPVSDLPWAQCMESVVSAADSGVGVSPTGIEVGSWVIGFFLDGNEAQRPFVLGTLSGVQNGIPDVSGLARGEDTTEKDASRTTGVSHPGGSWDEPPSAYAAEYPHNKVRTTRSGHIKEYDDTPGNERIHEYHRAGTFYEIDAGGNKVVRVVGNDYEIIIEDKNVNVKGDCNITVNGDCNTLVKGDCNITAEGDGKVSIEGSSTVEVGESADVTVGERATIESPQIDLAGIVNVIGMLNVVGPFSSKPGSMGGGGTFSGSLKIENGDVEADSISLKTHVHSDPQGGTTGEPI